MKTLYYVVAAVLTCAVVFSPPSLSAQTPAGSFQVISNGSAENPADYTTAIQNANFEPYRLQGERVRLSFDNGFTFELLSAIEMAGSGFSISTAGYPASYPPNYLAPVLHLAPNGTIGMEFSKPTKTKE